jgi:tetratricopeptide (TPR) repeat protein
MTVAMLAPPSADAGRQDRKLEKQARKHAKAGRDLLRQGKLDAAIDELQVAYGLSPEPELLFSLGEAYEQKQEVPQALYYYRAYRDADAEGAKKHGVDAIIAELEGQAPPTEPPPDPPDPPPPPPDPDPDPEPAPVVTTTVVHRGGGGGGKRIVGLVLGGVGLVVAGGGGYYAYVANARESDISALFANGGTWSDEYARLYDEGRTARTRSIILLGAGGAAVVAGAVLYYLGVRDGAATQIEVAPATGGGATVEVTCAF